MVTRLFNSLVQQGPEIYKTQIIAVDDNSPDTSYQNYISTNYKNLNVELMATDCTIHCPGNTRKEGMRHVEGEYVFFCDQDDYFEPEILSKVTKFINSFDYKPWVVSTIVSSYNQEDQVYESLLRHKRAWLHGKFYNVDDLIRPYNIDFKENLVTHEDIFFNSVVAAVLLENNREYSTLDIKTYRWVNNRESLTRQKRTDRGYFYENFMDYVSSAAEPFWSKAQKGNNNAFAHQVMMTLLHCYFYYEAASYYEGPQRYKDIAKIIEDLIKAIVTELGYSLDDIVNYLYMDPIIFEDVLEDCRLITGFFIPKTSLRDFIYHLGQR